MPSRVAPGKTSLYSFSSYLALLSRARHRQKPHCSISLCPQEHSPVGGKIKPENCCYGLCFVEVKMLEQESDCLIAPSLPLSLSLTPHPFSRALLLPPPLHPHFFYSPLLPPLDSQSCPHPGPRGEPYRLSMKHGIISFDGLDNSRSQSNE